MAAACVAAFAVPFLVTHEASASAPLKAHAAARNKFIGFAAATDVLQNEAQYRTTAIREFNQVTAENAMKWDATEPSDNQYNFTGADQIMQFAETNNMVVHGHTLVWHSQTPDWVKNLNASAMRTAMQDHISRVVAPATRACRPGTS
jgi:endo-1,4-beta-xylanase